MPSPAGLALLVALWGGAPDSGGAPAPRSARADSTADVAIPEVIVEAPRPAGRGFPYPITVLDPSRRGASPARDLGDLLAASPGAHVRKSGGPGSPSFLSLRGVPSEGVLVLLDGDRLNGPQGGGVDLSQVPLAGISRVEVLRGGASLLHGAGALGGVVEIASNPSALRSASRVDFEGGSLGTVAASGSVTQVFSGGWARVVARSFRTDGSFTYEDAANGGEALRGNAGGTAHFVDLRGELRSAGTSLRAAVRSDRSEGGSPGLADFPTPNARREDARDGAQLRFARRAGELSLGWSRTERAYSDAGNPLGSFEARHRVSGTSLRAASRARRRAASLEAGIEGRHEALDSTTDGDRTRRTAAAFGVLGLESPRRWTWTAGVRGEATTSFAPVVSTRLGVSWEAGPLRARAMAGTSHRPPTFDDLFWPPTGMAVGNPDLRPERAADWNLGVDVRVGGLMPSLALDLFTQEIRDMILWNPGPSGIWRPSNIGRAEVRGVEATLVWNDAERGGFPRIEASATFQEAVDRTGSPNTDGRDLPGRARRLASWRVEKAIGSRVRVETAWRAVGDVPRTAANTKSIPGYVVGGAAVRVAALSWLTARAEVENVGDVAYEDFHDFPLPGRLFRFAVECRRSSPEPTAAAAGASR